MDAGTKARNHLMPRELVGLCYYNVAAARLRPHEMIFVWEVYDFLKRFLHFKMIFTKYVYIEHI